MSEPLNDLASFDPEIIAWLEKQRTYPPQQPKEPVTETGDSSGATKGNFYEERNTYYRSERSSGSK